MAACRCHLTGTFHLLLSLHVGKVVGRLALGSVKFGTRVIFHWLDCGVSVQQVNHLQQMVGTIDFYAVDHRCLVYVLLWHDQKIVAHFAGFDGDGEGTADGAQRTVEAQFANEAAFVEQGGGDVLVAGQNADRQREVIARSFLAHVGRCEVCHKCAGA